MNVDAGSLSRKLDYFYLFSKNNEIAKSYLISRSYYLELIELKNNPM